MLVGVAERLSRPLYACIAQLRAHRGWLAGWQMP